MRNRRLILFLALVVLCVAVTTAALLRSTGAGTASASGDASVARALANAQDATGAALLVRRLGDARGALATTGDDGVTATAEMRCDRVHAAAGTGLCINRPDGFASGYQARVFDRDLQIRRSIPLSGVPSRARVSRDGRLGAVTTFVTGHSYAVAGEFSTETVLLDLRTGERLANLEEFTVLRDGLPVTAEDANFWGVTFAPGGDRFYATLATGGLTYLITGSARDRTARTLATNVECPSLSPDGTRIAYKHRVPGDPARWRLSVLELRTMERTPLADRRSVDDQAEWLGDDRVAYGASGGVWSVRADGNGQPERVLADADSPAALRPAAPSGAQA
jgi:hypothetical protein